MPAQAIKPIRPTALGFNSVEDAQRFINYATDRKKTESEELNRLRNLLKNHKRATERK